MSLSEKPEPQSDFANRDSYGPPQIETILNEAELAREVLYAGAPFSVQTNGSGPGHGPPPV